MAMPESLKRFTSQLPFPLRRDLESYLRSVDASRDAIYAEADVSPEQVNPDLFLFAAGVWRIWTQIDSQRWVTRNSLALADQFGAASIQAGSVRLAKGSEEVKSVQKLHQAYGRWLRSNDLEFIVGVQNLRSILVELNEQV